MSNEEFLRSISLEGEVWKDVVGWEGLYAVSNFGRVASFERYVTGWARKVMRYNKPRIMSPRRSRSYNGVYHSVDLKYDGRKESWYVHRLVATHFIPNDNPLRKEVDHIDRNTINNHVSNLRWVTHAENQQNENTRKQFVKSHTGSKKPSRYIPIVAIKGDEVLHFASNNEAKALGFHPSAICHCCKGRIPHHKGYKWMYLSDYENLKSAMS